MQARVLAICEGGLVVQFLHSNAVLRCTWHNADIKPEQKQIRDQIRSNQKHKREQIVTLSVLQCVPPRLIVEVVSVHDSAVCSGYDELLASANQLRRRQFLGSLQC
jgi:hypothetical protein